PELVTAVIHLHAKGRPCSQNWLRSIIHYLCSQEFPRLRIGIGPVPGGMTGADYVLSEHDAAEWELLQAAVEAAASDALTWVAQGVEAAMSRFNRSWAPQSP